MSRVIQGPEFFTKMKDALGLPKSTHRFEIHCGVDEAITVKCEYFPEIDESGKTSILTTLQDYGLFVK